MRIIRKDSPDAAPPEVQALLTEAAQGNLEPIQFCTELEARGIVGAEKLPYLLRAFDLTFEDAKEILIGFHSGSVEKWADEIQSLVGQFPAENVGLDDPQK